MNNNFEKWTKERVMAIVAEAKDWLLEPVQVTDKNGVPIVDAEGNPVMGESPNVFFKYFLMKKGIYKNFISEQAKRYDKEVLDAFQELHDIQEEKLQMLPFYGKAKENMAKYVLANRYDWREKSDNRNQSETTIVWKEEKTYEDEIN
jgi:hypothetical protein